MILHVFDFDDTLFTTDNTITIRCSKTGEIENRLTSEELAKLESENLAEGGLVYKKFTYEDFEEVKNPRPIHFMVKKIKKAVSSNHPTVILTAREKSNTPSICKALTSHGIDSVPVFSSSDYHGSSTPERKKKAIETMISSGNYFEIRLYDDSEANINSLLELIDKYSHIKFRLYLVKHGKSILRNKMSQEKQPIPTSKKNQSKSSQHSMLFARTSTKEDYEATLDHLKIAQHMDNLKLFQLADEFDGLF